MVDTKPPGVSGGKVEKARGARVVKRWRSAQPHHHQSSTALKPANTLHLSKDDFNCTRYTTPSSHIGDTKKRTKTEREIKGKRLKERFTHLNPTNWARKTCTAENDKRESS